MWIKCPFKLVVMLPFRSRILTEAPNSEAHTSTITEVQPSGNVYFTSFSPVAVHWVFSLQKIGEIENDKTFGVFHAVDDQTVWQSHLHGFQGKFDAGGTCSDPNEWCVQDKVVR